MVLIMGIVIRGCGVLGIRIMSQWRIDAIVRYILLISGKAEKGISHVDDILSLKDELSGNTSDKIN